MAVCLLLTATINVGATVYAARTDPATRLADYRRALQFWVNTNAVGKIIFCENSSSDLTHLQEAAVGTLTNEPMVEFLSFRTDGIDPRRGKGAGEMAILDHALRVSRLLEPNDYVLKVTGRHIVTNAVSLVQQTERSDPPDIICNLTRNLSYADSRVFLMRAHIMRSHLISIGNAIDDSMDVHFEHILARAVLRSIADGYRWELPAVRPDLRGTSGTTGRAFGDGPLLFLVKSAKLKMKRLLFRGLG